ncbi:MAG: FtsQ-type POTRA domain-containing protein [Anaerolineales bacterium]|jgi:hypothetical protein
MSVGERTLGIPQSRADQVRARRARKEQRIERPGKLERQRPKKRSKRARRRYDLSLSQEYNTQIQLTALPAGYVGQRLFAGIVLVLAVLGLARFMSSPGYRVGPLEIEGAGLLTAAQVRSLAEVEGMSAFLVDPQVVAARLEEAAEVESAQVSMSWPRQVRVTIKERKPAAEWDDAGRIWWLSADGVAYIQHGVASNLVRIQSDEPTLDFNGAAHDPVVDPDVVQAATELQSLMPDVASWTFDPQRGLSFPDSRGWKAYFGTDGDIALKVKVYSALAQDLEARGISASIVSVENPAAPFYSQQ